MHQKYHVVWIFFVSNKVQNLREHYFEWNKGLVIFSKLSLSTYTGSHHIHQLLLMETPMQPSIKLEHF